jgi:hypothetical protein
MTAECREKSIQFRAETQLHEALKTVAPKSLSVLVRALVNG